MSLQRIAIVNAKGGSGKSTVAMNLATFFAAAHHRTVIMDYDPQGSCFHWHIRRSASCSEIVVRDAVNLQSRQTRTFQLSLPSGTEHLIMDTPAGLTGARLGLFLQKSDVILIPVAPSALDVQATSLFLRSLVKEHRVRTRQVRVGVIINRLRKGMDIYPPLLQLIDELKLPVVATFTDSLSYIALAERGMGIHDQTEVDTSAEQGEWLSLARWLSMNETENDHRTHQRFSPKLISNAR